MRVRRRVKRSARSLFVIVATAFSCCNLKVISNVKVTYLSSGVPWRVGQG